MSGPETRSRDDNFLTLTQGKSRYLFSSPECMVWPRYLPSLQPVSKFFYPRVMIYLQFFWVNNNDNKLISWSKLWYDSKAFQHSTHTYPRGGLNLLIFFFLLVILCSEVSVCKKKRTCYKIKFSASLTILPVSLRRYSHRSDKSFYLLRALLEISWKYSILRLQPKFPSIVNMREFMKFIWFYWDKTEEGITATLQLVTEEPNNIPKWYYSAVPLVRCPNSFFLQPR